MAKETLITVQVVLRGGQGAREAAAMVAMLGDYLKLADRLPLVGDRWSFAGDRAFIFREDYGE